MSDQNRIPSVVTTELAWLCGFALFACGLNVLSDMVFPRPPAVYLELYPSSDHIVMAHEFDDHRMVAQAPMGVLAEVVVPQRVAGFASPLTPSTQINISKVNDHPHVSQSLTGPSAALVLTGTDEPDCRAFFSSRLWWNCGISEVGLEF